MSEPPRGPDSDPTEPIPVTRVAAGASSPEAGVHRFGNVGTYLIARFLAFAIDFFVLAFVLAAFAFGAFERGFVLLAGRSESGFTTLALASFGVAALGAFLCESLFGTTLGKAIFGLRVTRTRGGAPGVARVFARYALRPIDLLAVGPLLALATPRHQRLGDFAAGTVVSRSRFGPLASLLAFALLGGILYAQYAFGGGLDSALGVSAEAANYGPDLIAKSAALLGVALPPPASGSKAIPAPAASAPSARPILEASPPASDEPSPDATAPQAPAAEVTTAPHVQPTEAPANEATEAPADKATEAPADDATGEPTDEPTGPASDAVQKQTV